MSLDERVLARVRMIKPASALKSAAALPFYLLGWAVGTVWFLLAWTWASLAVGFADGRRRPPAGENA